MTYTHLVVMGVSGCGKTTVATAISKKFGWEFAEGDKLHPAANVAKMSAGHPLTDEDRWPWLDKIVEWIAEQDAQGKSTVTTCSALKRAYRDRLRKAPGRILFIHMVGSEELLAERMASRENHYMPPSLLPSQFATLEPLQNDERGFFLESELPLEEQVARVVRVIGPMPATA